MKPYYEVSHIKLFNKDCRDMAELPDESVDLLVTDPPYGIGFMGKDWDKFEQKKPTESQTIGWMPPAMKKDTKGMLEFFTPIWRECLRVLKPGAFAFVMCIPRADCLSRMIISLEDAGFRVDFTPIYWAYASGFPKAQNIGKAVDKRLGVEREVVGYDKQGKKSEGVMAGHHGWAEGEVPITKGKSTLEGSYSGAQFKPAVEVILVAMKPLSRITRSDFAGEYDYFYTSRIVIKDKDETGRKLKVKLEQKYNIALKAGDVIESRIAINPRYNDEVILNGKKLLESKPYTNSDLSGYISEALKNRKGITWLDDGRIPYESKDKPSGGFGGMDTGIGKPLEHQEYRGSLEANPTGRFPANLICSDDVLNDGRISKSGVTIQPEFVSRNAQGFQPNPKAVPGVNQHPDSGSFSRYFDLDKWWAKTFPFLIVPKASKAEKNKGLKSIEAELGHNRFDTCANCGGYILQNPDRPSACHCESPVRQHNKVKGNYHPTVKPVKLMSYLITLGSREGDTVLDNFAGSGTTGVAAQLLGRRCTMYEIDEQYCEMAANRCRQLVLGL